MKLNFQDLNIEPMPNPKPIHVQRVSVTTLGQDGKNTGAGEYGFIRNSNLHPDALTGRG
jgi:hypothetical protein